MTAPNIRAVKFWAGWGTEMSALTRSNLASRRSARRERVEVKHHPEVFELTEEQALVIDRAGAVIKTTEAHYALPDLFALSQQNRGVL